MKSSENICLKTCSASFPRVLTPALHPELLSGGVESRQLQRLMIQSMQRQMARAKLQLTTSKEILLALFGDS